MTLRRVAIVVLVAAVAVAGAILVSAAVDEPSKRLQASATIDAPRRVVWRTLIQLDAYSEWNPTIVSARGSVANGATLHLRVRNGDGEPEGREVDVLDVRQGRKLHWQDRLLVPGLRDRELTIRVLPQGAGKTLATAVERYEGLLVPFADTADERAGLERMLAALKTRAES